MTDTTKRYRLKKDYVTPRFTYAKGADVSYLGGMYVIGIETFTEEALKTTPEWFEEVLPVSEPVKEMVGVTVTEMNTYNSRVHYGYSFNVHSVDIDCGKIKQAIESALNDTVDLEMYKLVRDNEALKSLLEQMTNHAEHWKQLHVKLYNDYADLVAKSMGKTYTQSEVDAIRSDTWKAARKATPLYDQIKYEYFDLPEYLSSLNLNSNDTLAQEQKEQLDIQAYAGMFDNEPEQPTNDNAFVWTDALVMEIIGLTHRAGYHKEPARVYDRIQSFRQSKQSAPEPSALPNKEWEIIQFYYNNGKDNYSTLNSAGSYYVQGNFLTLEEMLTTSWAIHSVRRLLPDMEVFSCKDNTNKGVIESFVIITEENRQTAVTAHLDKRENIGKIAVKVSGSLGAAHPNQLLEDLEKLPPTPTQPVEDKPVLFTTEDRVDIREGDEYYIVWVSKPQSLFGDTKLLTPYMFYADKMYENENMNTTDARYFKTFYSASTFVKQQKLNK